MFTVFTGSGDARARAFDAQSGALQRVFRGHAFVINCIQVGARAAPGLCLGGEGRPPAAPRGRAPPAERPPALGLGRCRSRPRAKLRALRRGGRPGRPRSAAPRAAPRPQVHEQVLYTASHDGALRLWDVRGLPCAPPPRPAAPARSRSRLFSNKVGCAAAPLQPA